MVENKACEGLYDDVVKYVVVWESTIYGTRDGRGLVH